MGKMFAVTQTREVQVEAENSYAATAIATRAFYGNRPAKADPEGRVVSAVQVKSTQAREV